MSSSGSDNEYSPSVRVATPKKESVVGRRQPTAPSMNRVESPSEGQGLGAARGAIELPMFTSNPLLVLASVASSQPCSSKVSEGRHATSLTDIQDIARWRLQAAEDGQRLPVTPPSRDTQAVCANRPTVDFTFHITTL